ncbi:AMP-binding protein [Cellulomonas soli]|uniref:AMP-dependent synthetase/ligase domain-containing protein n=1 Tax=Cellulomonas soli TaxID=931535 RepID=A0A512PB95_9CELL|nr:AMP-binding protein [Cellulomonas soli]NYI61102.1 phenylacetate-CoA ligase [Cellulomonas soli]GEP68481.1 hypothetical protein CSO01_11960 [Cellulomonas soli]
MRTTEGDGTPPAVVPDPVLSEYAAMGAAVLGDDERWPTLGPDGLARVAAARAHPHAPVWVHATGDRLRPDDHEALRAFAARLAAADAAPGAQPTWIDDLVARAHAEVPRYRRSVREGRTGPDTPLSDLPTVTRRDLVEDLAAHVPVGVPLDRVLEGTSSGSTGAALRIPLHPVVIAADVVLLRHVLAGLGVPWVPDPGRLVLANVVEQRAAFTYASAVTAFDPGGLGPVPVMARLNLDDAAWRRPGDRERYLADVDPQVLSTSTLPLLRLLDLAEAGLELHPVAVVNGATELSSAVREAVGGRWGVPVVDLYGLRETGAVAVSCDGRGHVVVPRRVHVEILDATGSPVADGVRGEVVVTVDENPYLPLLRYRTGDHAAVVRDGRGVVLVGLEGRAAVRFRAADGSWRPSIDATQLLQGHGLSAWHLRQDAGGGVRLAAWAPGGAASRDAAVRAALDSLGSWLGRVVTHDLDGSTPELRTGPQGGRWFTCELPVRGDA